MADFSLSTQDAISQFKDMVYRIALSHTRYKDEADDAFQETFLTLHQKSPVFNGMEHVKAWLIRTAINCSARVSGTYWKKNVQLADQQTDASILDKGVSFEFESETQSELFSAVQELPEKYRVPIVLFYLEDLSIADISKALEISEGTIKVQLSRGRDKLRETLIGVDFDD
jgi:RNA polymerase sigma-70 factor (ECF subfamily)